MNTMLKISGRSNVGGAGRMIRVIAIIGGAILFLILATYWKYRQHISEVANPELAQNTGSEH